MAAFWLWAAWAPVPVMAQNNEAAISVTLSKQAAAYLLPFQNGFHGAFLDGNMLIYHTMGPDFNMASSGNTWLGGLGLRPEWVELNANHRHIYLYYERVDSAGLWCCALNTINGKWKKQLVMKEWDVMNPPFYYFSHADTLHAFWAIGSDQLQYRQLVAGEEVQKLEIRVEPALLIAAQQAKAMLPQVQKWAVLYGDLTNYHTCNISRNKAYLQHRYLYLTVEGHYSTYIIQVQRKANAVAQYRADMELGAFSPVGAVSNSCVRGHYLYQAALCASGAVVQRFDMHTGTSAYTAYIGYEYSPNTQSEIFLMNRGETGELVSATDRPFAFHREKTLKYMGITAYKKGPFDHYAITEVEPLERYGNWLASTIALPAGEVLGKSGPTPVHLSHRSQSGLLQSARLYSQCMASTLYVSVDSEGNMGPYMGEPNKAWARAAKTYHDLSRKGAIAMQPAFAQLYGKSYYCFYLRKSKLYYFILTD
jgi:hypothetical protein